MCSLICLLILFTFLLNSVISHSEPLVLTPLLKAGRIEEAQQKSFVPNLIPGVHILSYSGFFTVNKKSKANNFFWFHPRENCKNWWEYPTILWLQGGMGLSFLRGSFVENLSPYNFTEDGVIGHSDYSLAKYFNVLQVDHTDVGFSFKTDPNYIATNFDIIADETYSMLDQFFTLFPKLKREICVAGHSGSSVKAIYVTKKILLSNRSKVDVSGMSIGDGILNLETDISKIGEYFYNFGLIPIEAVNEIANIHQETFSFIRANRMDDTYSNYFKKTVGVINKHMGYVNYDIQDIMAAYHASDPYSDLIERKETRDKLHVGNLKFTLTFEPARKFLNYYFTKSQQKDVEFIVNSKVPYFKFNGQYDGITTYQSSMQTLYNMDWYGKHCFRTSQFKRKQVWINDKLMGYYRSCFNVWDYFILRSPHVVQKYTPEALFPIMYKFMVETNK